MISFYSGTPGSGKSLMLCREVEFVLNRLKKNVIANVQYDRDFLFSNKLEHGKFYYLSNQHLDPDFFYKFALKFHKIGKEGQTTIVLDEAQYFFSPTACKLFCVENPKYRQEWLEFFSVHRHLGFDIIIVSQFDKLIDPQIRCLFEYNYVHRKANNYKTIGNVLTILHIKLFVQIQYWYGSNDKCGSRLYTFRRKYGYMYDSYSYRNVIIEKLKIRYGEDIVNRLLGKNGNEENSNLKIPKNGKIKNKKVVSI